MLSLKLHPNYGYSLMAGWYYSQSQEKLYEKLKVDICDCMQGVYAKGKADFSDYKECFKTGMLANMDLLQKELAIKYPDSVTYEKSYEYGQALGRKLDTALVYCCDIYFKLTDSLRFSGFNSMNKDSLKTELQKLNGPGLPKAEKVLEKKAALNFILGNYKDANTYAEEVLNYKPDHLYALVYKSYFLELEKKYDEALVLYSNLAKMTGQGNYLVWVAIVSRKKRELKSQP